MNGCPKTDPKPGDVLRTDDVQRTVLELTPAGLLVETVRGSRMTRHKVNLGQWQRWAKDASVVGQDFPEDNDAETDVAISAHDWSFTE